MKVIGNMAYSRGFFVLLWQKQSKPRENNKLNLLSFYSEAPPVFAFLAKTE